MNLLPRFGQAFPTEAGPQDFMPLGGALPRALEGRNVKLFAQRAEDLFEIHSRLASRQAVIQHALLQGRERITVLDHLYFHLYLARNVSRPARAGK
jgi:hypothetical protein